MNTPEAQELKLYEVSNRNTGQRHYAVDYNAQDACLQTGCQIGDCYVVEQKPIAKYDKKQLTRLLVKIPCHVCPYVSSDCNKPDNADCPVRLDTQDLNEWLKETSKASICLYTGEHLSNRDYQNRLKTTTLEQAIKELSPKLPPLPPQLTRTRLPNPTNHPVK
ncbi:unnamed protein product [marine sediment metagenome]|uniref:Uncharacterized protein n=1 Tax=marine sediment metagenome TaxID=412755 RepID=X1RLE4_9ZZZZ